MAAASGGHPPDLTGVLRRLHAAPHRFEFFEAVRHLERAARKPGGGAAPRLGRDAAPAAEPVRFRSLASLEFPAASVVSLAPARGGDDPSPPEMIVAAFGLLGVVGPLPDHYSELVIRRLRMRDRALRDFLDLFNHRAISLFYRAWEKYRLAPQVEGAKAAPGTDDDVSFALFALAGRATSGHRGRLEVHDDVFLRFAGHFSRRTRPAASLEAMLTDYFGLAARVEQFQGEMLCLPISERTMLPPAGSLRGRHNVLGRDAIVGAHAFDVTGRFRIRVGPMPYERFRRFLPTGDLLRPFCQLARSFVGPELAFDVRPVLSADQTPPLRLAADPPDSPRLGWNTWLGTKPLDRVFGGVSFSLDGA
jgi:type VI secretion system protein ImpH